MGGPNPVGAGVASEAKARPFAKEFIRHALIVGIEAMLVELDNPPLVDRIFPNGWRNGSNDDLTNLYDLCVRTFIEREKRRG